MEDGYPTKIITFIKYFFPSYGAPVKVVAASGTPEPLPAAAGTAEDVCDVGKIQMELGVVGVEEFTGEQVATIVDKHSLSHPKFLLTIFLCRLPLVDIAGQEHL